MPAVKYLVVERLVLPASAMNSVVDGASDLEPEFHARQTRRMQWSEVRHSATSSR
jgi:hypothetical protein